MFKKTIALLLALLMTMPTMAQTWPSRPIRFIVPFAAGGGTDLLARLIAQQLSVALGQPVLVDNRSGASGVIGTDAAAKAVPDGYTIMIATPTLAVNPSLIYVSISGFGQVGPFREKPAMDAILQAFTGFMSENHGRDGLPHRTPTVVVDMSTGLYAQQAVAAALFSRAMGHSKDGGSGRRINASLMEGAANLQSIRMMSAAREGRFLAGSAPGGTYATRDGYIQIGAVKNHEFQGLCKALGLTEIGADPKFATNSDRLAHAAFLIESVASVLETRTAAEWRVVLTEAGLQNEVVQTYGEFVRHPQAEASGVITWTLQQGSDEPWATPNPPGVAPLRPGTRQALAPNRGEHTRAVLSELGYGEDAVAALLEAKVVAG